VLFKGRHETKGKQETSQLGVTGKAGVSNGHIPPPRSVLARYGERRGNRYGDSQKKRLAKDAKRRGNEGIPVCTEESTSSLVRNSLTKRRTNSRGGEYE